MFCIISPYHTCYTNLAMEEYLLNSFQEDVFYLYINEPCIVVGKNQNTHAEINHEYVESNDIPVVRRLSGGGTVYHDLGNLNYGFISKNTEKEISGVFEEFTAPIISALRSLGLDAGFLGRNDLSIEGKKISGNAQYHSKDKVLHHGTLLFSSDLTALSKALKVSPLKFEDKGIKSIRSRVANISDFLSKDLTISDFQNIIMKHVLDKYKNSRFYILTDDEKEKIKALSEEKYSGWDWNYGASPDFTLKKEFKYEKGLVQIYLNISSGILSEVSIYGDFFGRKPAEQLETALVGIPYEKQQIQNSLSHYDIDEYISGLTLGTLIDNLFPAD